MASDCVRLRQQVGEPSDIDFRRLNSPGAGELRIDVAATLRWPNGSTERIHPTSARQWPVGVQPPWRHNIAELAESVPMP